MASGWPPLPGRAASAALAVIGVLLLSTGAARGQDAANAPPRESWWWVGGGGGIVFAHGECTDCADDQRHRETGAFVIQGGLRVSERLLVGVEVLGVGGTSSELVVGQLSLLALVQFRPFAAHGFFLKGGVGPAVVRDTLPEGDASRTGRSWGMSVMYGAGWIFGRGRRVSVAPFGAQYVTAVGGVRTPAGTAQNLVMNGWFVGAVLMAR